MDLIEWAIDPWGQTVAIHIAWVLIWVAAIARLAFVVVHAIFVRYFARAEEFASSPSPAHCGVPSTAKSSIARSARCWLFAAERPRSGSQAA